MRRLTLVAYDIADPKRLRRVHKVVRDFGDPLQYSLFLCALSRQDAAVLETRLARAINQAEDQVMLLDLGPEPKRTAPLEQGRFLGKKPSALTRDSLVF